MSISSNEQKRECVSLIRDIHINKMLAKAGFKARNWLTCGDGSCVIFIYDKTAINMHDRMVLR